MARKPGDPLLPWLRNGRRTCSSSIQIAHASADLTPPWRADPWPYTTMAVGMCELMMREMPETRRGFDALAAGSFGWRTYLEAWPELVATLEEENGPALIGRYAPRTEALVRRVEALARSGGAGG